MTNGVYVKQVADAFSAVTFISDDQFLWLGRELPGTRPRIIHTDIETRRFDLVARLAATLYDAFYCSGGVLIADSDPREMPDWASLEFVDRLSKANSGRGFDEHGWEVRSFDTGSLIVRRRGLTIEIDRSSSETSTLHVGDIISLRSPKDSVHLSPGYYFAFGNEGPPESGLSVRLYWNTIAETGIELIRHVTRCLNAKNLPFGLKVLTNSTAYRRADSAVLYLAQDVYLEAVGTLIEIYQRVQPELRAAVPAFTKRMAPGVGLAESPPDGISFGHHRSLLLADAIEQAHATRARSKRERSQIYEAVYRKNDLEPMRPYLNPRSQDSYVEWQTGEISRRKSARRLETARLRDPLEVASRLGHRLTKEALWWEGRCTWLSIESDPDPSPESASAFSWSTLDPCLYSGATGVALFLAQLTSQTGETSARKTAEGALRQALSLLDQVPPESRFGYYAGWGGVVAATLAIAEALNSDEFHEAGFAVARRLVDQAALIEHRTTELDLMSGKAGTIAAIAMWDPLESTCRHASLSIL